MTDFPDLSSAKIIGFDTETYDPELKDNGPGWARGVGHVLGVSLAVSAKQGWYIEVGEKPETNVLQYLKDTLGTQQPKVGANLLYDVGWMAQFGVPVKGPTFDIQFAEALLDDTMIQHSGAPKSVSLDSLALQYLGVRKGSDELEKYTKERWPWQKDFRENLWRCPPELVAKYAISDAMQPIQILSMQWPQLANEKLLDVFKMECELIPLLVAMRMRGVKVDLLAASEARDDMMFAEELMLEELNKKAGFAINVNSSKDLARLFDALQATYPLTAKGNPSFTADWLANNDQPIAIELLKLRQLIKMRSTFIENAILGKAVSSRLYPSLHPLRSDDSGTISGRFSSSQPNQQQLPKRNKQWAPIVRGLFVPDDGYPSWLSIDLSQIEYRLFAHFSHDLELIASYQDRSTDYHEVVSKMLGGKLPRPIVKNFNFMMLYGGGKKRLAAMLAANVSVSEATTLYTLLTGDQVVSTNVYEKLAEAILMQYDVGFPAAKLTMKEFAAQAEHEPNYVRTVLGRKSRFKLYESPKARDATPKLYHLAKKEWGLPLRVAGTYKAVNRVLQGSAADLLKKAMLDAFKSGVFDKTGVPHLSIHDELCFSYHPDLRNEFLEVQWHMENAIKLKVPVIANASVGPTWGSVKEVEL